MNIHPLSLRSSFLSLGLAALCAAAFPAFATMYNVSTAAQFNTALAAVMPGDTIVLSGNITSSAKFSTTRDGSSTNPITITGDGTAILHVSNTKYGLEILHDYYRLSNFKIQNAMKALVIDNADHGIVDNVHAMDIRQEAFKVRNQSHYWLFTNCSARRTGTAANDFGEGFYVGQAQSNWIPEENPQPDQCGYVTFYNCYTTDTPNDGWDVKEGSHHVKIVNCTADFSGATEPAHDASRGSAGVYLRADNIQVVKCKVNDLGNTDWAYRISNQTINGINYGSTGNEIKESSVTGGNVALIFAESGTGAKVYTDCVAGPGGLKHANSSTIQQPAPGTFTEMTWSGEGGGIYGNLSGSIGAAGDPLSTPTAAPVFNPAAANYAGPLNVTITSATSNATIRYTTNGATPTSTNGTIYSAPVAINSTATLKAIAYKSGLLDSTVTSGLYEIGLINDTFTDGLRNNQSLPGSAAWYANSGGNLAVSGNNTLSFTPSVTGLAYFTAAGAPRVVAVGGTMKADFKLKVTGTVPSTNDYMRAILLNSCGTSSDHNASSTANRVSADGYNTSTAAFVNNAGYMVGFNPGAVTMKIYRRNFNASGGVSSSSAYTQMGSNGGTGAFGLIAGNTYNGTLLIQRTSSTSVTVSLTFTGTFSSGGTGTWTYSQVDSTAATYTFDMVAFFISSGGVTALELDDITVTQTP